MTGACKRIDVVVVSVDARMASRCLKLLRKQTAEHQVVLVTNGIPTADVGWLGASFPEAEILPLAENVGFGRAVNAGAQLGTAEAIVLINDDVEPESGFLSNIVEPLEVPAVGMVAALLLQASDPELIDGFGIEVDASLLPFNRLRNRRVGASGGLLVGPTGGAAAYRRQAWESVGGFDPAFFAYSEDLDLALRLRRQGWRAAEAPGARGIHVGGASFGVDSPLQVWNSGFGRGFMLRRYGVLRSRQALRALLVEAMTLIAGLLRRGSLDPLRARVAGWRGASAGPFLAIPPNCIDPRIGLSETIRRLRLDR